MLPVHYRFLTQAQQIRDYLHTLQSETTLAIDVEADSLYSYPEKVCLVQISTPTANTILDPLSGGQGLQALAKVLASPSITKVFHGGGYDIRLLKKAYQLQVRNVADTMIAAQLAGRPQLGLSALLEEEFGIHLQKRYQRANWGARPLDEQKLSYAALDTAYLLPLWQRLRADLLRLGRLEWAQEEFELLEAVTPAPQHGPSCFDVKGGHRLRPRERAILQALVELRDETARAWDRPPFKVLGNEVLLQWAQEPPAKRREVLRTPRANKGILRRLAARILDAVRAAQSTPLADCPQRKLGRHHPPTEEQRLRLQRLKTVRQAASERLDLSPGLLVTSGTLERLSRADPHEAPDMLPTVLKRWQLKVLGPSLLHILRQ